MPILDNTADVVLSNCVINLDKEISFLLSFNIMHEILY